MNYLNTLDDGEKELFKIKDVNIKYDLYRTGTIKNESCLFNSILYGFTKKHSNYNKKEESFNLRETVASIIELKDWRSLGNGSIAYDKFRTEYRNVLNYCSSNDKKYKKYIKYEEIIKSCRKDSDFDTFIEILRIMSNKIDNIISESYNKENNIRESVNYIVDRCRDMFNKANSNLKSNKAKNDKELNRYMHLIKDCLINLYIQCELYCFNTFIEYIGNKNNYIGQEHIELICDAMDLDLYFIDSETRLPYKYSSTIKNRDSIILLWFENENHYEVLCRNKEDKDKYIFRTDDNMIETLKEYILN
jgi:hypothetical protein